MRSEVLTLAFDYDATDVVMVGNAPSFEGKTAPGYREYDAPRGSAERGEQPWEAARRVYEEQVGVEVRDWVRFAVVDRAGVRLHCFYSVGRGRIRKPAETWEVSEVLDSDLVPDDLKWLVPMASVMASGKDDCAGYVVSEDDIVEVGRA